MVLPPGTILQCMHLERRLRSRPPGVFVDVGAGGGHVSRLLLELGWRGTAFELAEETCLDLRRDFAVDIADGRYTVTKEDWVGVAPPADPVDLVVSSMVLEHLDEAGEAQYLANCRRWLHPGGLGMVLVPGSPSHWGVEDVIAGHFRRYTRERLLKVLVDAGMEVVALKGLTFPLSNMLLPLSNVLVAKAEGTRAGLSMRDRTEASGHRAVHGKTNFPAWTRILLNRVVLWPFDLIQRMFSHSPRAMILSAEFTSPGPLPVRTDHDND